MRIIEAKTSMDGKTLFCDFDDGRSTSFPYPIPMWVKQGRLAEYAEETQRWLDQGGQPGPVMTEAESTAQSRAANYIAQAERERERNLRIRAKELADSANDTVASEELQREINALE